MNFLTMKYFLTLAEEKSFTRAAEKLFITQQTLSSHIAGLEREVGARLFVRHVPLELTDAGEVFYRYARIFSRNALSMKRELADVTGNESGTLRIGIAPSRGQVLLPPVLAAFHDAYPKVRVHLIESANGIIWQNLRRDAIDLAIARLPGEMPGISHKSYGDEEIVLLLADSLIETLWGPRKNTILPKLRGPQQTLPEEFAYCPFLINSEVDIAGALARKLFREASFEPHILVESENMATMLALCVRGLGAYFCPGNLADHMLPADSKKSLRKVTLTEGTYTISFGWQNHARRWSMVDSFIRTAEMVRAAQNG